MQLCERRLAQQPAALSSFFVLRQMKMTDIACKASATLPKSIVDHVLARLLIYQLVCDCFQSELRVSMQPQAPSRRCLVHA